MSSIPGAIGRVPTLLAQQISLRNITSTNVALLQSQSELASGRRVNRVSDDPVGAALIRVLDDRLARSVQRGRNLDHASSLLSVTDQALGELSNLALETKSIASSQVGFGSDSETRALQAQVVSSVRNELLSALNRDYVGVSLFAGSRTNSAAFDTFQGGVRYLGDLGGLQTDLGGALGFPLTLNGQTAAGAVSARVQGDRDLNPALTVTTPIDALQAVADGQQLGSLTALVDRGGDVTTVQVDLSDAATIGDVVDILNATLSEEAPPDPLGAGGVGTDGTRLSIDVAAGAVVEFVDGDAGSTATALGLAGHEFGPGDPVNPAVFGDLNPRITAQTALADLAPTDPLEYGEIRFRNGAMSGVVTVTAETTAGELVEAVRKLGIGVELKINDAGDGFDVVNEVSGLEMSVEEVSGTLTASTLGIRSFGATTALSTFNGGRGVEIADGVVDANGDPDPDQNLDFTVTLSDGTSFDVDLTAEDITSVGGVIAKIEADAAAAGIAVGPTGFSVGLAADGNGLALSDNLGGPDAITVTSLNGFAAEDLGLLDGTSSTGVPATLVGSDRARVEVDSVFTTLLRLERALLDDDVRGITFAADRLDTDLDRIATARALVGTRTDRVESAAERLTEASVIDESVRSQVRDVDFAEAATRFTLLQTQLQAAYTATAQTQSLTLLSFLG